MQHKKRNFKIFEIITLAICLFMFSIGSLVYYYKIPLRFYFFPNMNISQTNEVGEVSLIKGKAKRKANLSGTYSELNNKEKLFEFDTIKTDSNSKITIKLHDGSFINLEENSIMVLEFNSSFSWNKGLYRSPIVKVIKGNAVAEKLTVKKTRTRKIASKKQKNKRKVKKVSISKKNKSIVLNSPQDLKEKGVLLSWNSLKNIRNYSVEFYDPKVKKVVFKASSNDSSLLLTNKKVLNTKFMYRVSSRKGSVLHYSSWGLYDRRYLPPTYLEPDNTTLKLRKLNGKKIVLSWEQTLGQKYIVELSGDKSFKKVSRYPASKNFKVLKPNRKSKYYWRVRTVYQGKQGPPSKYKVLNLK